MYYAIPMEEYRNNYNLLQFSLISNLAVDNFNQVVYASQKL